MATPQMGNNESKPRMPQRSKEMAGDETKGLTPIPAAKPELQLPDAEKRKPSPRK